MDETLKATDICGSCGAGLIDNGDGSFMHLTPEGQYDEVADENCGGYPEGYNPAD